jgi:DNA-binding LytR/AlgR family response regulator
MTDVVLIASERARGLVQPVLRRLGWTVGEKGPVHLVERGFPCPERGLVILFDLADVPALRNLLAAGVPRTAGSGPAMNGDFITGRQRDSYVVLPVRRVLCFRSDGDTVTAEHADGVFEVEPRLYEIEALYGSKGFVRVGKSLIVNVLLVTEIIPWFGGRLLLKTKEGKTRLEVSRSYVKGFKQFLGIGAPR